MSSITIFTPSFNRAHLLPRLYESLVAQTSKDFIWLIVDDGSDDGTDTLAAEWVRRSLIEVKYVRKENGGMHTAHNLAYDLVQTELSVCIDSDDMMPQTAVENILAHWQIARRNGRLAGMLGVCRAPNGEVIGTKFPKSASAMTLSDVYHKANVRGDKKIVLRSDVVAEFPRYPVYPGERLVPLSTLYSQICSRFELLCLNETWAIVEYQESGSSATVARQYFESPMGFRYQALFDLKHGPTFAADLGQL